METKTITLTVDQMDLLVWHLARAAAVSDREARQAQRKLDELPQIDARKKAAYEDIRDHHRAITTRLTDLVCKIGHVRTKVAV